MAVAMAPVAMAIETAAATGMAATTRTVVASRMRGARVGGKGPTLSYNQGHALYDGIRRALSYKGHPAAEIQDRPRVLDFWSTVQMYSSLASRT